MRVGENLGSEVGCQIVGLLWWTDFGVEAGVWAGSEPEIGVRYKITDFLIQIGGLLSGVESDTKERNSFAF